MKDTLVVNRSSLMLFGFALIVLGAVAVLAPVFAGSAVVITIGHRALSERYRTIHSRVKGQILG